MHEVKIMATARTNYTISTFYAIIYRVNMNAYVL